MSADPSPAVRPDRRGVVAFAAVWMLLIPTLTFASPVLESRGRLLVPTLTRVACSMICHQRPERSWRIAGALMPLCARCAGLAAGFGLGVLIAGLALRRFRAAAASLLQGRAEAAGCRPWPLRPRRVVILLALATAPLAVDGSAQWLGLYPSPAEFRTFTGVLCGAALSFVTIVGLALEAPSGSLRPATDPLRLSADSPREPVPDEPVPDVPASCRPGSPESSEKEPSP